jgi:metal-responsive CopG/Arc/MetJ family transcriptional regulator
MATNPRPGKTVIVSITLPRTMADMVDRVCEREARNRSELIREALRTYMKTRSDIPGLSEKRSKPVLSSLTEWTDDSDRAYDALR